MKTNYGDHITLIHTEANSPIYRDKQLVHQLRFFLIFLLIYL
jgi:hypothetical protein